jgi:glycosyltransferase involved in cell wall biosynthesis
MKTVFMNWQLNNSFGWGILGLNIFCQWANDPAVRPTMGQPIIDEDIFGLDPLRISRVVNALHESNKFLNGLVPVNGTTKVNATVIDCLGNGLLPSTVVGTKNIGRCIFEDTRFNDVKQRLAKYDALLCGSNWNADLLKAATGRDVKVILEGIDPSLFCPGGKSGILNPDIFYIFSGGKIEYRKGQDLVLLAFREFSKKHDDAVLVTAWHSPWPQFSTGFRGRLEVPLEANPKGMLNVTKWVADNGIRPDRFIDIGRVPNQFMPTILREMDVALQPSRAEACTNLPVKEAMACALPVIIAHNTGMHDLITDDNCIALKHQKPAPGVGAGGTDGWGESDVDEIVCALEDLYMDRERRKKLGHDAARWIAESRTWKDHAKQLKDFVLAVG